MVWCHWILLLSARLQQELRLQMTVLRLLEEFIALFPQACQHSCSCKCSLICFSSEEQVSTKLPLTLSNPLVLDVVE